MNSGSGFGSGNRNVTFRGKGRGGPRKKEQPSRGRPARKLPNNRPGV